MDSKSLLEFPPESIFQKNVIDSLATEEERVRNSIRSRFHYVNRDDLKEVTAEAFAQTAEWQIKDADFRNRRLSFLMQNRDALWSVSDVELLCVALLEDVLSVFTRKFKPSEGKRTDVPDFINAVYPFIQSIRISCIPKRAEWNQSIIRPVAMTLAEKWEQWVTNTRDNNDLWRGFSEDYERAKEYGREAIDCFMSMAKALFRELHPVNQEIKSIHSAIEALVCPARNASGEMAYPASEAIMDVLNDHLDELEQLTKIEQPTLIHVKKVESCLDSILASLAKVNTKDQAEVTHFVTVLRNAFSDRAKRLCICPVFRIPGFSKLNIDWTLYRPEGRNLPIAESPVQYVFHTPPEKVEDQSDGDQTNPKDKVDTASPKSTYPIKTKPIEMALILRHFTAGGFRLGLTRDQLNSFALASIQVPICDRYGYSKKECFEQFLADEKDNAKILKLVKDLLEWEDENSPPEEAAPANVAERNRIRAILVKAGLQIENASGSATEATTQQTPRSPSPVSSPKSPSTPEEGPLVEIRDLLKESLEVQKKTSSNTAGAKTAVQNAAREIKTANAIAGKALEAENRTAENTGFLAEAEKRRQQSTSPKVDHTNSKDLLDFIDGYLEGSWIDFRMPDFETTGNTKRLTFTQPEQWKVVKWLAHLPPDRFGEQPASIPNVKGPFTAEGKNVKDATAFKDLIANKRGVGYKLDPTRIPSVLSRL